MNERKLDPVKGDISVSDGHVVRTSSFVESVLQTVRTFVSTFEGECLTDRNAGVPWFDKILGSDVPYADYAKTIIEEKVPSVPGVKKVLRSSLNFDGRKMSGSLSVALDSGETATVEV